MKSCWLDSRKAVGGHSFRFGFVRVFLFALVLPCLVGCDIWYKDMRAYLEYWSSTVQMGRVEVTGAALQKNDAGVDTLPVSASPTITGYIINPKQYPLNDTVGAGDSTSDTVRVSDAAVEGLAAVSASDYSMIAVRLAAAGSSLEHTTFTVNFVPVRTETGVSAPGSMAVTLQYNTPPAAPIRVKKDTGGSYSVLEAGDLWEADDDGCLYWAWDDSGQDEKSPGHAKWFEVNGKRRTLDECKVQHQSVDGKSLFRWNTGPGGGTLAAVDSQGVSGTAIRSGELAPAVVTLDLDGGHFPDGTPTTQTVAFGSTATRPPNPTKDNWTFKRWKDAQGNTYNFDQPVKANITITADWCLSAANAITYIGSLQAAGSPHTVVVEGNITEPQLNDIKTAIQDKSGVQIKLDLSKATLENNTITGFRDCAGLVEVTIPESVTTIANNAFNGCSSLVNVVIPDSVTAINTGAFQGCISLVSVDIPDSVTAINVDAFNGCSSLANVIIPDSVTTINMRAFQGCSSLTSITIPDLVTTIGVSAFADCSSLASVTIGKSIATIETNAFMGCNPITVRVEATTPPALGYGVFLNNSELSIQVPAGTLGEYQQAWATYVQRITEY